MRSTSAWHRHPNWKAALAVLGQVAPGSIGYEPDEIAGMSAAKWVELRLDGRGDAAIAADFWEIVGRFDSRLLIVVSTASYGDSVGPFFVSFDVLDELIESHVEMFGDQFFGTDAVIVDPASGRIAVAHHNQLAASFDGVPAVRWI